MRRDEVSYPISCSQAARGVYAAPGELSWRSGFGRAGGPRARRSRVRRDSRAEAVGFVSRGSRRQAWLLLRSLSLVSHPRPSRLCDRSVSRSSVSRVLPGGLLRSRPPRLPPVDAAFGLSLPQDRHPPPDRADATQRRDALQTRSHLGASPDPALSASGPEQNRVSLDGPTPTPIGDPQPQPSFGALKWGLLLRWRREQFRNIIGGLRTCHSRDF